MLKGRNVLLLFLMPVPILIYNWYWSNHGHYHRAYIDSRCWLYEINLKR